MTEGEWLSSADPDAMAQAVAPLASDRKLRLFACACCRYFFCDPHGGDDSVEAEILSPVIGFVDGVLGEAHLRAAGQTAARLDDYTDYALYKCDSLLALAALSFDIRPVWAGLEAFTNSQGYDPGELRLIGRTYLFDIFGNPFRPVAFSPSWCTDTAIALARQMYDSREFGTMPILADAIQDAGCDSDAILDHCRSEGPHVRGCWVVDMVLGKQEHRAEPVAAPDPAS